MAVLASPASVAPHWAAGLLVAAKVRPLLESDGFSNGSCSRPASIVEAAPAASQIILGHNHFCDFDAVFGPDVSQKELYTSCLEDLVTSFFEGYNVSVVGYGARGSGKTHTITGPGFLWAMNEEQFGLLPRAVRQLYRHIAECRMSCAGLETHVSVSYLLLCAGAVYDLLSSQTVLSPLPILADHKGSVMVPGLSSIDCNSITEVLNCLEAGLVARHNHASTVTPPSYARDDSQASSSSSPPHTHASFTITLQQERQDKDGRPRVLCSRLNFVDLSGLDQQSASLQHLSNHTGPGNASLQGHSYRGEGHGSALADYRLHHRNLGSDDYYNTNNNSDNVPTGGVTATARNPISNDPSAVGSPCSNSYTNTEVLGGVGACAGAAAADRAQSKSASFDLHMADTVSSGNVLGGDDGYHMRRLWSDSEDVLPVASDGEDDSLLVDKGCGDGEDDDDDLCEEEDGVESSTTVMSGAGVIMSPDHQCLSSVIACLVDPNFSGPVPYAHSMLTQLLKEGLGGNCLTLLVCCAAPTRHQLPATLLTMRYGGLARYILNRPIVNDITSQLEAAQIQEQQQTAWGVNSVIGNISVAGSEAFINVSSSGAAPTNPVAANAEAKINNDNNTAFNNTNVVKNIDPEELFRMQWLVWQLQQLVEGADCLLRAGLPFLPPALQGQAGVWLRHRADPAHRALPPYVGVQQPSPSPLWPGTQGGSLLLRAGDDRTLHVIEELSEPGDLNTSSRNESSSAGGGTTPATPAATGFTATTNNSEESSERSYDSAASSSSSLGEEFHEQLAVLASQFADYTASLVRAVEDRLDSYSEHVTSAAPSSSEDDDSSVALVPDITKEEDLDSSHEKMDTERAFSEDEYTDDSEEDHKRRKERRVRNKTRSNEQHLIGRNSSGGLKISFSESADERLLNSINMQNTSTGDNVVVLDKSTSANVARAPIAPANCNSMFSCKDGGSNDSNKQGELTAPTSEHGEPLAGRPDLGSFSQDDDDSDANMDSYDSEEEEGEDTVSSDGADNEDAEPSIREHRPSGLSRSELWQRHSSGRRLSTAGLPTHLHEAPSPIIGALPLQEHEANRRKKRELLETIREKESQLHELQRKARWLEQLLHQNQATLLQLQQLTEAEVARLADARRRARAVEAHREQHRVACSAVLQHERTLQQYRERSKRLQNLVKIMDETKLPPSELESLSSRLRELRCELAEVETAIREDDQRKQHLTRLRRDRPRRQSGAHQAVDEDMDDDLDPLISSSPPPIFSTCPSKRLQGHALTSGTVSLSNTSDSRPGAAKNPSAAPLLLSTVGGSSQSCGSCLPHDTGVTKDNTGGGSSCGGTKCQYIGSVRRERVVAGSEEHITLRRGGSKAVVSVHGLSQPHKRRLLSSSSEQCQSSADGQTVGPSGHGQKFRVQISRLREARDALAAWRQRINRKMRRGTTTGASGSAAERRLLELDEAVEAVDNAIEYKNELLCGRTDEMVQASVLLKQGKLLDCLLNLSDEELRTLLLKYFNRVIDLRIEFRMQEISSSELEIQFEDQGRQLQRLKWSYQQASLNLERKCAVQQRQHLHHLHKLFRHIHEQEAATLQPNLLSPPPSQDSSSSGPLVRELEMSLYYYKDQCTQLKTLIRQQQGRGYKFQPVYQQLQDQETCREKASTHHHQQSVERRTADIGLKLTSLGPGGSLLPRPHHTVHAALVHKEPRPHHQTARIHAAIEAHDNANTILPGNEANVLQQHQYHRTSGSNTREPEPQQPFRHHSSHNPFMRRSHLEPRSRKRPPSSASRYLRGLGGDVRGLARASSGPSVGGGRTVEAVPMVDLRFRSPQGGN